MPESHRDDANRLALLRNSDVGYSWPLEPQSGMANHNLSFLQEYGEFEAALQLDKEA